MFEPLNEALNDHLSYFDGHMFELFNKAVHILRDGVEAFLRRVEDGLQFHLIFIELFLQEF